MTRRETGPGNRSHFSGHRTGQELTRGSLWLARLMIRKCLRGRKRLLGNGRSFSTVKSQIAIGTPPR